MDILRARRTRRSPRTTAGSSDRGGTRGARPAVAARTTTEVATCGSRQARLPPLVTRSHTSGSLSLSLFIIGAALYITSPIRSRVSDGDDEAARGRGADT